MINVSKNNNMLRSVVSLATRYAVVVSLMAGCTKVQDSFGTAEKDLNKTQTEVSKTADAIKACQYLDTYANEIQFMLKEQNYRAALSIASAAYFRTLETSDSACIFQVKELISLTEQMVMDADKSPVDVSVQKLTRVQDAGIAQ